MDPRRFERLKKTFGARPRKMGRLGPGHLDVHHERVETFVNRGDGVVSTRYMPLYPGWLRAKPQNIREEVSKILASFGHGPGHIFNLGHGITPDINPDNVTAFVDAVQEISPQYHS